MVTPQSIGFLLPALPAVLLLASCASAPTKEAEKKPVAEPVPVTGLTGLYRCFGPTRQWAQDIQVLRVQNLFFKAYKAPPGKAYAWQVAFVSPSKKRIKNCTYSVVQDEGVFEGVFSSGDEAYNGPTKLAQPFVIQAVKKDTDDIYEVALEHSKEYAAKNPDVPIRMLLELTERNPVVAWRVLWGESVGGAAYSVFVDSANGTFLKKAF